jgi:hypothetical protein
MYENYRIYGPYIAKDGRLRITGVDSNNVKHTISYPKYLMELHLGRYLDAEEQVDHIDGNPLNNELTNLQIKKLGEHQALDVQRNRDVLVHCKYCGKPFIIKGSKISSRNRKDRHQSGYFCSRVCSGKYGRKIQLKQLNHTIEARIQPSKYKAKSAQNENSEVEAG